MAFHHVATEVSGHFKYTYTNGYSRRVFLNVNPCWRVAACISEKIDKNKVIDPRVFVGLNANPTDLG